MTEFTEPGGPLRQSLLRLHDACPLSAKFSTEVPDYQGPEAALGSAMHLVAEEMLRTLHRVGERQMPTEEAVVLMTEVLASPECPHLTTKQMDEARMLTLMLANHEWTAHRILAIEERLFADVRCPDGEIRAVTGQPDVLVADPPQDIIVADLKFGRTRPPKPRDGDWGRDQGKPYLSERGHFQLDLYAYLVFLRYPDAQRCTLREAHLRIDEYRQAYITRDEMEHVERRVGIQRQRLEEVLTGKREAEARAGAHCHTCARPEKCPIAWEDRGEGAIKDDEDALLRARRWVVASAMRDREGRAVKGWLENNGSMGIKLTDDSWVGWKPTDRSRRFGVHSGSLGVE